MNGRSRDSVSNQQACRDPETCRGADREPERENDQAREPRASGVETKGETQVVSQHACVMRWEREREPSGPALEDR
jgi:hypothetical protein